MTFGADAFAIVKKLFLVNEELIRLSSEVKELTRTVIDHEVRISVIENTLTLTRRSSRAGLTRKLSL